jgi:hypothetical protein
MKTLTEQYEDARRAYFRSRDKRPHAAITVRLRDKMQNLMLACLKDWHARNSRAA